MAEFDARGFKTGCPELAAIWVSEMNWALSAWELDS
jgi:hypothetical protein